MIGKRDYETDRIITREFDFEDFFKGVDTFENRRTGAITIVVNSDGRSCGSRL